MAGRWLVDIKRAKWITVMFYSIVGIRPPVKSEREKNTLEQVLRAATISRIKYTAYCYFVLCIK